MINETLRSHDASNGSGIGRYDSDKADIGLRETASRLRDGMKHAIDDLFNVTTADAIKPKRMSQA